MDEPKKGSISPEDILVRIRRIHGKVVETKRMIDDKQAVLDDIKSDFKSSCDEFQEELTRAMILSGLDISEYNEMVESIKGVDNED